MNVPFLDLGRQTRELAVELRAALDRTLDESRFIGGSAVAEFEHRWAAYCGVDHVVGCGSGGAAIEIALRARGVGAGDEVICPANTCIPTVAGVAATGATPVLADVDEHTLTLDPTSVRRAVREKTKAIVAVHLYGRCADVDALRELGVFVLEDAAHAHGARGSGRPAGSLGDACAFSFYPTKNLGALGDAGAVATDDPELAARCRELREFGPHGVQSRLDTLQAAVLLAKLPRLDDWNARRRELAARYRAAGLPVEVPPDDPGHVYHLFAVRSADRDGLRARLLEHGVETAIHYSPAIHRHPSWSSLGRAGELHESEQAAASVLSLPLYPELTDAEVDHVIACFGDA